MKCTVWPVQQHWVISIREKQGRTWQGKEEYVEEEAQTEDAFSAHTVVFIGLHGAEKACYWRRGMLYFLKGIFGLYKIQISLFLIILWTLDYHKCLGNLKMHLNET